MGQYLQEEIAAEAIVRNIGAFSRFLEVAALCNSEILNYTSIANDAQVPANTVREYFQILKDTLLGTELPSYKQTIKRKPIATPKFYFFDIGVVNYLQKRQNLASKTPEYGTAFETYIFHELISYCDYHGIEDLSYWRSTSKFEVDFILNNQTAIEVKAKENITQKDLKGLKALREEELLEEFIVVCLEKVPRLIDGIRILPYEIFLKELYSL